MSRFSIVALIVALSISWTSIASAQSNRDRAAKAFDEGVTAYDKADYATAARAFMRADEAMPSADALQNALSAARKSNDYMLVVEVSQRALSREASEPALGVKARQALSEAAQHLAKLELKCEPTPCSIEIDGVDTPAGTRFVLPGVHTVTSTGEQNAKQEERLTLAAGSTYQITMHPAKPGEAAKPVEVEKQKTKAPDGTSDGPHDAKKKPLSPAVFYVGVGATVVLAGITTWSGLDAMKAKNDLGSKPSTGEVDDVRSKVRRTDFLLAGTVVVGALTTYAGFALVDFGGKDKTATVVISPVSRTLFVEGRF